jgi:hypothetical protein
VTAAAVSAQEKTTARETNSSHEGLQNNTTQNITITETTSSPIVGEVNSSERLENNTTEDLTVLSHRQ